MVKPANPRIRRFFAFKAVFNLYKNAQSFFGSYAKVGDYAKRLDNLNRKKSIFRHKNLRRFNDIHQ